MHGLGADGSDFVPVVAELGLDPSVGIRFVFSNAPAIPVTYHCGRSTRAALHSGLSIGTTSFSRLNFGYAAEAPIQARNCQNPLPPSLKTVNGHSGFGVVR
jgi:hypothetical protein